MRSSFAAVNVRPTNNDISIYREEKKIIPLQYKD